MTYKIEIRDSQLKALVDKAMADLEEFYPDKAVESLNARHKGLSNRIGELWKRVGYPNREAFLAAYGFTVITRPSGGRQSGGRPPVVDPEKLMTELVKRYEGREKPDSVGALIQENLDLKGPIKTVQNKASEVFGHTFAKELAARGLLSSAARTPGDVSKDEIEAMLDALVKKYAHAAEKPTTMSQLKADNPEYSVELAALALRSSSLYQMTPKKKLTDLGIFKKVEDIAPMDADQLQALIDALGEKACDVPNTDKPKTIDELTQRWPDFAKQITAAAKQKLIDKKMLQALGFLAPSATAVRTTGIRKIKVPELVEAYKKASLQTLIEPEDGSISLLPSGICGIDVETMVELRHALVMFKLPCTMNVSVGDSFQLGTETFHNEYLNELHRFCITTSTITLTTRIGAHDFLLNDYLAESKSPLIQYVGAKAVKVSQHGDMRIAQFELTWLATLRRDTLVAVLRASGIVRDPDLLGGFGWRFRIWQIENGLRTVDELRGESRGQLKPKAATKKSKAAKSAAGDNISPVKKSETTSKKEEQGDKATNPSKKTSAKKSLETADEGATAQKTKQAQVDATAEKGEQAKEETTTKKNSAVKKAPANTGKSTLASKTEKDMPKAAKKKSAKPLDSTAADATTPKKANGGAVRALKQSAENVVEPTPAKKTLGQVLAQVHESVEQEITKGAPGTSGLEVARESRAAVVSAGGDGSPFDAIIKELERQEASGMTPPPRQLGRGDLAQDKPLGQLVELLRASGGGLTRSAVTSKFGDETVESAVADKVIVESNGKLYLWCQHDRQGRPMRDFKPAIDSLQERLNTARKEVPTWTPAEQARLGEVAGAQIEARRQLDNAGFFQFSKKKELKARIEELGRERGALEKVQLEVAQAQKELDALQDELNQAKAAAKKTLEERGLL